MRRASSKSAAPLSGAGRAVSMSMTLLWNLRNERWVCATRRFSSLRSSPITARPSLLRGRSFGSSGMVPPPAKSGEAAARPTRSLPVIASAGRVARVHVGRELRSRPVERVEVERRRAEVLDPERVGLLVVERRQVERDVVVDELAEVGEAGRDVQGVAGGQRRAGVEHGLGQLEERVVGDLERRQAREHAPELAGIAVAVEGVERRAGHLARRVPVLHLELGWDGLRAGGGGYAEFLAEGRVVVGSDECLPRGKIARWRCQAGQAELKGSGMKFGPRCRHPSRSGGFFQRKPAVRPATRRARRRWRRRGGRCCGRARCWRRARRRRSARRCGRGGTA